MLGVGWTEMLLIGVVALIVIGPKDLPVVMSRLGKFVAQIRRMGTEFQREINKTTGLDQITDLRRSISEPLRQTAAEITREFNKTTSSGATVPSGVIAPKDPASESVVDEINAKLGMTPATPGPIAPPVMTGPAIDSPAPAEAMVPAKPRKPRAKRPAGEPVIAASAALEQPVTAPAPRKRRSPIAAAAPAAAPLELFSEPATAPKPRKPRTPKPKTEA